MFNFFLFLNIFQKKNLKNVFCSRKLTKIMCYLWFPKTNGNCKHSGREK